MKKFSLFITAITLVFIFGGCTTKKTLQTTQIVTACAAYGDTSCEYTFFVAAPKGSSEEGGSETSLTSYTFTASNFSDAVEQFKDSSFNVDLSHMSIFLTDESYISNRFTSDASHIKQKVNISPLIKVFVSPDSAQKIVDSISSNYGGNASKYIEAAFAGKKKNILCTMSELFFASVNPYYTASLPSISVSPENTLPKVGAFVFYNSSKGTQAIENEDYNTYRETVTTFGKSSKLFDLSYLGDTLFVTIEKNFRPRDKVCQLAQKYQALGFDIFNSLYFSKSCFPTYFAYQKSINKISVSDIIFNQESK